MTARGSIAPATRRRWSARCAASPRRSRRLPQLHGEGRRDLPDRVRALRPGSLNSLWGHGQGDAPSHQGRRAEVDLHHGLAACEENVRSRIALSFPSAVHRRQSAVGQRRLRMVVYLEKLWGVHFAMGAPGALVRGLVGWSRAGQPHPLSLPGRAHPRGERRRHRRTARDRRGDQGDIVVSNADANWTYDKLLPEEAKKRRDEAALADALAHRGISYGTSARPGASRM